MRTISKFVVKVIDTEPLAKSMKNFMLRENAILETEELRLFGKVGIVEGIDGKHYLLNTEGVGSGISLEESSAELDWYRDGERMESDGKTIKYIGIYPCATTRVTLSDLLSLPVVDEVLLHEFIRTFGRRLDENYATWEYFLRGDK